MATLLKPFQFLWLIIKLLWVNSLFLGTVLFGKIKQRNTLIIALSLLVWIAIVVFANISQFQRLSSTPVSSTTVQASLDSTQLKLLTQSELLLYLSTLQKLEAKQPNHVPLLLNLSAVEAALGNQEKALEYKNRAIQLDPNSPDIVN